MVLMDTNLVWWTLIALVASYVCVFGILRRANGWYYARRLGAEKTKLLPPGDLGWPAIGKTLSFLQALRSTNPDQVYQDLLHRYGRVGLYKTHLFGKPTVVACSPETCRRVLTDNQRFELGYPAASLRLFGEKGLHGVTNEEHNRIRRLITPPISGHEALSSYTNYVEELVIKTLDEWAGSDRPIELAVEINRLFFRVITQVFLGPSSNSVLGPVEELYGNVFHGLFSWPINLPGFRYHKALQSRRKLEILFRAIVDERMAIKTTGRRGCMMDLLIDLRDEDDRKLDDRSIVDLLLTFLVAGHETSSIVGLWATINLHQHPEVLRKAKDEQEKIVRRRPSTQKGLTFKEIKDMQYLRKVLDETLRVLCPQFSLFRVANVDVNIDGYLIPKGWMVFPSTRVVHTDPENYADPKVFEPSRWDMKSKPGAFIPFGGGSRICPGAELAKLQIFIFLHYFLLDFKLEQLNPTCRCMYFPSTLPADNCLARIRKITKISIEP